MGANLRPAGQTNTHLTNPASSFSVLPVSITDSPGFPGKQCSPSRVVWLLLLPQLSAESGSWVTGRREKEGGGKRSSSPSLRAKINFLVCRMVGQTVQGLMRKVGLKGAEWAYNGMCSVQYTWPAWGAALRTQRNRFCNFFFFLSCWADPHRAAHALNESMNECIYPGNSGAGLHAGAGRSCNSGSSVCSLMQPRLQFSLVVEFEVIELWTFHSWNAWWAAGP